MTDTTELITQLAERIFEADQPNCKWSEFNKKGWVVRDRYTKIAETAAAVLASAIAGQTQEIERWKSTALAEAAAVERYAITIEQLEERAKAAEARVRELEGNEFARDELRRDLVFARAAYNSKAAAHDALLVAMKRLHQAAQEMLNYRSDEMFLKAEIKEAHAAIDLAEGTERADG